MTTVRTFWLALAALAGYLGLLLLTQQWGAGTRPDGSDRFPNLLEDPYDRMAYQMRGRWAASGATPYLEEFSEYPQLTTWMMGLPYAFFDHGVERGEPHDSTAAARQYFLAAGLLEADVDEMLRRIALHGLSYDEAALASTPDHPFHSAMAYLGQRPGLDLDTSRQHLLAVGGAYERRHREIERNFESYGAVHHVVMGVLFAVLIALVLANLRLLGAPPATALLLLLPGTLYFGFNRHDLPVTVLVAFAVHMQLRGRFLAAGWVLGVAVMTKWYPLVLVPLFLSHGFWSGLRAGLRPVPALLRRVVFPGLAVVAVIVPVLSITYFWNDGGFDAVRNVFDWHRSTRQPNHASLLGILTSPESWGWLDFEDRTWLTTLFQALQLLPAFALALLPLRTRAAWLEAAILVTCGMVIFSKFFSPQWVLWIIALAVLRVRERPIYLWLIVALQLAIYVQLPVAYYWSIAEYGTSAGGQFFRLASDARVVLLFVFQGVALFGLVRALRAGRDDTGASGNPAHSRLGAV